MTNSIVRQDVQTLVDGWLKAEQEGDQFPVDFDLVWRFAGYGRKSDAKRGMKGLKKDKHFSAEFRKTPSGGRPSELIRLSCDGMKHLCLVADTPEGEAIRDYFIDAEKKWKLVQMHAPQVASEVEFMHLKIELAKIETQKEQAIAAAKEADERLLRFRHAVTTTMPDVVQQKVLGYSEVKTVEYRDRVLHNDDMIRDGSTINKTEMCRRLSLVTKNGSPDYKQLNRFLQSADLPPQAWKLVAAFRENEELDLDYWQVVQQKWVDGDRNLYLGE